MTKVFLGCLIGRVAKSGLLVVKAILDFIYLSQYHSHNTATLQYMVEALDQFNANKNFFIETGIHSNLKIPKSHSLYHFIESIKLFGLLTTTILKCLNASILTLQRKDGEHLIKEMFFHKWSLGYHDKKRSHKLTIILILLTRS